jgi:hypothetical protein
MKSRRTVKAAWRISHITDRGGITDVGEAVRRTRPEANVSGITYGSSQHRLAAEIAINMGERALADVLYTGEASNGWDRTQD